MYLLMGWRKPGEDGRVVIAASEDKKMLKEAAGSLNHAAHYTPGVGMWDSDETRGCFHVVEVKPLEGESAFTAAYQAGLRFINHEDKRR